jgi:hypothetical protein
MVGFKIVFLYWVSFCVSSWFGSESPADKTFGCVLRTLHPLSVTMEVRRWRACRSLEFVTDSLKDSGQVSCRPCGYLSIVCNCSQGRRSCIDAPGSSFLFLILFEECRQGGLLSFSLDLVEDCLQYAWAPLFACPPSRDAQSTHAFVPSCFLTHQWTALELGSLAHSQSAFWTRIALDIHPAGCLPFSLSRSANTGASDSQIMWNVLARASSTGSMWCAHLQGTL